MAGGDRTGYVERVADPQFINPTGDAGSVPATAVNLHLQASNAAEGGGSLVASVTDDYDGETRGSLTPVDIGADAGNFTVSSDAFAPAINYTILSNTLSLANRVLTDFAVITDNVGVSGGANSPRLYFKKSTDADVFNVPNNSTGNGWKFVAASNSSSPYSFTIDYSILNGGSVANGDTIQYFVVAQDDTNNFSSNPAGADSSGTPPVQNVNAHGATGSYRVGDFAAPTISYPLLSSGSTANRTLTGFATITDDVAVSGGANSPRLYFKRSTDADVFNVPNDATGNGWKYVAATNATSPYNFTIDYSILSGGSVSNGNTIQYFIVAQDAADNLGSNPAGAGSSANPPVQNINAKPVSVNSYTINATTLSGGTKTVCTSSCDYTSLTASGGIFAAINSSIVSGNIVISITGDLTEDGANGLNQIVSNDFPSSFTITIQPDAATMRTISGNVAGDMIRLSGADRVTIDGRFGGAGRFLTFRNTSTNSISSTVLMFNAANANTIRSSVIEGATTDPNDGVINLASGSSSNLITDNQIRDAAGVPNTLIYSQGSSVTVSNSNNTISNNELFNFTAYAVQLNQISNGNDSWTISGNTIYQTAARTTTLNGIYVSSNGTNTISGNTIRDLNTNQYAAGIYLHSGTNITISRNRIYSFPSASGSTALLQGIYNLGASPVTVVNNQITIIPSFTNDQPIEGIRDDSGSGAIFNAYYNSFLIGGTASGASSTWAYVKKAASAHTVRNNIFFNNRTGGTGNHFAAGNQTTGGTFSSNYNLFVGTGATAANFMDFGTSGAGTPVSFATWQASTGGDANSSASNPGGDFTTAMFVDPSVGNLNIITGTNYDPAPLASNAGTPVAGVTTDFDGVDVRSSTPDIGADEFVVNRTETGSGTLPPGNYDNVNVNSGVTTTLGGIVSINGTLSVACTGAISGASSSNYIIGNLSKDFCATGAFSYPVGTANGYSPVDVTVTALAPISTLTVKANQGNRAGMNSAHSAQRYWTLTETGDLTVDLTFNYLDGDINGTEANYNLYKWNGTSPTAVSATLDAANNKISTTGIAEFSDWAIGILGPTAADGTVTGRIVDSNGAPVEGAVVRLSGDQNRKFITDANGVYRFDQVETGGFYNVTPSRVNYTFSPAVISFSQLGETTEAAFGATATGSNVNPLDTPEYFVRQNYLDFLGREPDESGFNFWSDQILGCGDDAECVDRKRMNVSAAYFLSIEFQETGGLVDGLYRAAYGVRPNFAEFKPDAGAVSPGLVVGRAGWEELLENGKVAFVDAFVQRAAFRTAFDGTSNETYVDALIANTGAVFTSAERSALVSGLGGGMTRAAVLRAIVEDADVVAAKRNQAFVMMEYFGYLRREPDAAGYQFWLDKLNHFNGNFEQAEMVRAFIVSTEYRDRFPR